MSGFNDFVDVLFEPLHDINLVGDRDVHVVGTTLWLNFAAIDGDGASVNLSSGYTATMTPYVDGVALPTFTQTTTSGRGILLQNDLADDQVIVFATPGASASLFGAYTGKTAVCTLIVTRTSDGAAVPFWRGCNIPLRKKLNP